MSHHRPDPDGDRPASASLGGVGSGPGEAGERPKVSISVMRAALAAGGVPTAGLLERAEFEALYWKLQEGEGGDADAGAGLGQRCPPPPSPPTPRPPSPPFFVAV